MADPADQEPGGGELVEVDADLLTGVAGHLEVLKAEALLPLELAEGLTITVLGRTRLPERAVAYVVNWNCASR